MKVDRIVLLTGANGHLGRNIVQQLAAQGVRVRGLVLPGEKAPLLEEDNIEIVRGDVTDPGSLQPLFAGLENREVVVIHTAAVIDISSKVTQRARRVNVDGTKNVVALALQHKVHRFIHVSSVHAIPEAAGRRTIRETKDFSPDTVSGSYAKTKAEASAFVMQQIQENGLPGVIMHPSGIAGPLDSGTNNIVAAIKGYLNGRIPACPRGGYDIVDVRDVAAACISAIDGGRVGETYILSSRHYEFTELFAMLREVTGKKKKRCPVIPIWIARLAAPVLERSAKRKKELPLITPYSLETLASNDNFCHEKASRELGFWPRDIYETLQDTVAWLDEQKQLKKARQQRRKVAKAGA